MSVPRGLEGALLSRVDCGNVLIRERLHHDQGNMCRTNRGTTFSSLTGLRAIPCDRRDTILTEAEQSDVFVSYRGLPVLAILSDLCQFASLKREMIYHYNFLFRIVCWKNRCEVLRAKIVIYIYIIDGLSHLSIITLLVNILLVILHTFLLLLFVVDCVVLYFMRLTWFD